LKWFGLILVVANYALIELFIAWRELGSPPMLNNILPLKRGDPIAVWLMAPGIIALVVWPVLLIRQRRQKRDSVEDRKAREAGSSDSPR
jgi:hypothetical protein